MVDPLSDLSIEVESYDIKHEAYVYFDTSGRRCWTKAWFNGKEEGEPSVEIEERMAVQFIHRQVDKDEWLEEHYPKQMEIYHNAIEQTKEQILRQYNI